MTDIPSQSFGSNPAWFCKTDSYLCKIFNEIFTLPNQASWAVFSPSSAVSMKFISIPQMEHFKIREWLKIKKSEKHVGKIGAPSSNFWEWTLGYRIPLISKYFDASQASQLAYAQANFVVVSMSQLAQSLGRSRKLEQQSLWPMKANQSKPNGERS